ncbi:unnamed protein product [Candidula unifasciata]|uniref:Serum response factor-binding protein 1 n=1 Tax=Candidula unifasciata TaxID=100452 RepID=A0A8S3YP72_9EUPU|nr:unnamed protein product [Candidula unifasciata]
MDSRSIDFAKTASIDLMTLNNKVVNMRQVVKRAKVHVISKLCRHIHKLKMKQGTEEHKAKNLRKAERLIEEIDSMKKLKEDNISKYALANTASFDDLSKISLLPGPRALARLAEHPLLKRVVTDFRSQHSDWPDLAAYLLIKQTGRRFKTKKQKQKKLERRVENMNASETMTKAYIQGRFGQEGLLKAEQTFERKRKRPKSVVGGRSADSQHNNDDSQLKQKRKAVKTNSETADLVENKEPKTEKTISETDDLVEYKEYRTEKTNSETDDLVENKGHKTEKTDSETDDLVENKGHKTKKTDSKTNKADNLVEEEENQQELSQNSAKKMMVEKRRINQRTGMLNQSQLTEGKQQKPLDESGSGDKDSDSSDKDSDSSDKDSDSSDKDNDSSDKDSDSSDKDSDSSRDTADGQIPDVVVSDSENILQSGHISDCQTSSECVVRELRLQNAQDSFLSSDNDDDDENSEKYKTRLVPAFLTRANKTVISDPFFAGSDEEEDLEITITDAGVSDDDDDSAYVDTGSGRVKAKSMFYNPGPRGKRGASSERFCRGAHDRQSWDTRDTSGRLDTSHRSRTFTYGRQEKTFRGDYQSRTFRGDCQGRGNRVDRRVQAHKPELTALPASQAPPEKLHPSWEASKKRRAEQSGITTFRGSRLTFDDDD